VDSDRQDAERDQALIIGQFLIDRDGIIRWINIETKLGDALYATKTSFRDGIACFKALKESPDAVVLNEATDMNSALASRPSTIGLTDFVAVVKGQGRPCR
jgi:hypothetical protein